MNNEIITLENVLDLDQETMVLEYQLMSLDYEVLQEEGKFKETLDKIIKWFKDLFQKIADFFRTVTAKLFARFANLHKAYAKAMKLQNANKIQVEAQGAYITGLGKVNAAYLEVNNSLLQAASQESGSANTTEITTAFETTIKDNSSDNKAPYKLTDVGYGIRNLDSAKAAYAKSKATFGRLSSVSKSRIQAAKASENAALVANVRAATSAARSCMSTFNKYVNRSTVEMYRVIIGAKGASKKVQPEEDKPVAESFGFYFDDDSFNEGFDFESDFGFDDSLTEGLEFHMGGLVL